MAPGGVVLDAVGRIGRHERRGTTLKQAPHIRLRCRVSAQESVSTEAKQIARRDVRGAGLDDGMLIGLVTPIHVTDQRLELVVRPER